MAIIDMDVHNEVGSIDVLLPYLPQFWVDQIAKTVFDGPAEFDQAYPPRLDVAVHEEARVKGGPPGLAAVQDQMLADDVDFAILICTYPVTALHNPDQAIALSRAVNDWQIAEWLDKDSRLRASIVVPSQLPAEAAKEIDRVAGHPGFVQVALPARSRELYGNRNYRLMWEAIDRNDLVGGIHFGGASGNPTTPVGWPSYYIEEYVDMAGTFASQITNIVAEGLFDEYPNLRLTFIESGTTWLPTHLWRFDKEWKNLRLQTPWLRRPPSAYIREHVRFGVEPWDGPRDERLTRQLIEQLGSAEMLLWASGYPHASRGDRGHLLSSLSDDERRAVLWDNARSWYRL